VVEMLPAGRAIDRFGAKQCSLVALLLVLVGNLAAMAGGGIVLALVLRFVVGLGVGLGFVAGSIYVQSGAGGSSAANQGIYGGVSLSGGGAALGIVPLLDGPFGWRAPYVSAVFVALAGLAVVAVGPSTVGGGRSVSIPARQLLRDPMLARFGILHSVSFGFSVIIGNWVVTLLEHHGHSKGVSAAAGSLTLLLGFFTRVAGGPLLKRGDAQRWVAGSLVVAGAGAVALALPLPLAALIAAAALVGLASGLPFAMAFTGAAAARPDSPGAAVGFVNGWAALAIVAGAPLVGLTFSLPGNGRIGFVVLGILAAVAALGTPRR
jgi:MFS family permease